MDKLPSAWRSRCLHGIRRGGIALMAALGAAAYAGPWEARDAQGLTVRIEQDSYRTRQGYVLARRYADGNLDPQFAERGSLVFSLGPDNEGPASLRLDALGRAWVVGAAWAPGDTSQAVVLRFSPQGRPDAAYAHSGRAVVQPAGRSARALDIAPLPDGSAFVAGLVTDAAGRERSGWWRLRPDGSLDPTFGLAGLWEDEGEGSTEVQGLQLQADGRVLLRLQRGTRAGDSLETWALAPGESRPRRLEPGRASGAAPTDAAPSASAWPAAPAMGPVSAAVAGSAAAAPPASASSGPSSLTPTLGAGAALALAALAVLAAGVWWRRRTR